MIIVQRVGAAKPGFMDKFRGQRTWLQVSGEAGRAGNHVPVPTQQIPSGPFKLSEWLKPTQSSFRHPERDGAKNVHA
ncbi:hypothetical protein P7K49_012703, partial [Saguinus oedipus]